MLNVGVKALLSWVNSIKSSPGDLRVEDLQDGEILLDVVYKLKKETKPSFNTIEERFKVITQFVEKDCRFRPSEDTSLSWDKIRHGSNLTEEMAKVLLLLVYHDMMNHRCTLSSLECDVEAELAKLTGSYVMEMDGCVYFNSGLDAYLAKKCLPVSREILQPSASTSNSNSTSVSSLSDGDSPVFHRAAKVKFLDIHTVASSSTSKSPLQDIMNTPKFQLRKMKRQMIKEREYIDGLEGELAVKIALIAQKESLINQMQYRLDKMKNEQAHQEEMTRKQVDELETKNSSLLVRLDEILKLNKNWKSSALLMERKVDELTGENGLLSSQMRATCSQLTALEVEVSRLTQSRAFAQEEWNTKRDYLQSELSQASAQKELLGEQIQILQGKISCLEDEIGKAAKEDKGENMGPVMERDALKNEICSLKKAISDLQDELERLELQKAAQIRELQASIDASEQELETLKEMKKENESLLIQAGDKLKDLETRCQDLTSLLADKDLEITSLKEEVEVFAVETQKNKHEIETKDQLLAKLCEESSDQREILQNKIQTLLVEVENLTLSVKRAEEEVRFKQDLLAQSQQDTVRQREALQEHISTSEEEARRLKTEITAKHEQFVVLQNDSSKQSEILLEQIGQLKSQVESLTGCLTKAEEQVQSLQDLLEKQERERVLQKELLQQQLSASEQSVSSLKEEVQAKEKYITFLNEQFSEKSEHLHENVQSLEKRVETLGSSLKNAEESLQSKEIVFAEQQSQSAQRTEALQTQLGSSQQEVNRLIAELQAREEQLVLLKESSTHSELLEQKIEGLDKQLENLTDSLRLAKDQVKAKEELLVKQEQEKSFHVETLEQHAKVLLEEAKQFKEDIQTKEDQINMLKVESSKQCEVLKNDIQSLKNQLQNVTETLQSKEEQIHTKDNLLEAKALELSQERSKYLSLLESSTEEVKVLRENIQSQEERLVTLKEESSSQTDALLKEISQLNDQLAEVRELLCKAEQQVQTLRALMDTREEESAHQKELLQQQLSASQAEVKRMDAQIRTSEEGIVQLNAASSKHSDLLCQEIQHLKTQVESLEATLGKAEEDVQSKNNLLAQQQEEAERNLKERVQTEELLHKQISSFQEELVKIKVCQDEKEKLLLKAEEKLNLLQTELSSVKTKTAEKDQSLDALSAEFATQAHLLQKANEEAQSKATSLATIQEEASKQTHELQQEVSHLKGELEAISLKLEEKQQQLSEVQRESAELAEKLKLQLASVNTDLKQNQEAQAASLKQREGEQELQLLLTSEKEALVRENENLLAKVLQAQNDHVALEKRVEVLVLEKERLAQTKQATERENMASQKLQQVLQQEVESLKMEKLGLMKETEMLNKDLQEQLAAKSEAVEHYKSQMEKAASHYNDKKQLLIESHEEVAALKHSLEVRERELKAAAMEKKLLQLDLEKARSKETTMSSKLASLEAQAAFAQRNLRVHDTPNQGGASESFFLEVPLTHPDVHSRVQPTRTVSSDSLDQSSLEDSLNQTRKLSAPGESSTPFVRSSERLAAKRHGTLRAESLETLYFTPINSRYVERTRRTSICTNPSSSVKRRRTTQVINITLTKKSVDGVEEEEKTFLPPARSQPNLSSGHASSPISMELFKTPGKMAAGVQLVGLPGYRRSTLHAQTTSTFCVGAENEPDAAPNDWMRIAELQARNQACLPHLKSSYPVEFEACQSAFTFTDEEVRTGDPSETIRRASVMPGQLHDSLASHRHAHMDGHAHTAGQSNMAASTRSHRLPSAAVQPPTRSLNSARPRSPKVSKRSALTLPPHSSPEKKLRASCFPRPLTPKNKNINIGPAFSPKDRRESMMFTIENTPKNSSGYLKKGLNKIRSSARKSAVKTSKKALKENMAASAAHPSSRDRCKSQQGVSEDARKMMRKMKI